MEVNGNEALRYMDLLQRPDQQIKSFEHLIHQEVKAGVAGDTSRNNGLKSRTIAQGLRVGVLHLL